MKKKLTKKQIQSRRMKAIILCVCFGAVVSGCRKSNKEEKSDPEQQITGEDIVDPDNSITDNSTPLPGESVSAEPTQAPDALPYAVYYNDQLYLYKEDISSVDDFGSNMEPVGEITQEVPGNEYPSINNQSNVGFLKPALVFEDFDDPTRIVVESNFLVGNNTCIKNYMVFEAEKLEDEYLQNILEKNIAEKQKYVDLRSEDGSKAQEVLKLLTLSVPIESYEAGYAPNQPNVYKVTYNTTKNLLKTFDPLQQSNIKQEIFQNCAILFATNQSMDRCRVYLTDGDTRWAYEYRRRDMAYLAGDDEDADVYECSSSTDSIASLFHQLDKSIKEDRLNDIYNIDSSSIPMRVLDESELNEIKCAKDMSKEDNVPDIDDSETGSRQYYLLRKTKDYQLYGSKDYRKMVLSDGKEYYSIDYDYTSNYSVNPELYEGDFDGDGENELAVIISAEHGTGVNIQWLLMIEPKEKMCYDLPWSLYEKNLLGHMDEKIDDDRSMQLLVNGQACGNKLEDPNADDSWDRYYAGDQIFFGVSRNTIIMEADIEAIVTGACTGEYFDDAVSMEVNYEGSGNWSFGNVSYQ